MGRTLLLSTFLCLMTLAIGTKFAPNNPMFWLASDGSVLEFIRLALGSVLLLQLFTRPPRHILFRYLAGALAIWSGIWALQATYFYQLQLADSVAILAASVAIGITALERKAIDVHLGQTTKTKAHA